jgi:diguanylate cyclase (GGDEF)-like protein/PAS domain S-box-containing protein
MNPSRDPKLAGLEALCQSAGRPAGELAGELAGAQQTLLTILNNLPGMVYCCRNDRHWTILYVSEGCLELTGYLPAELLGNRGLAYADLIHPDDREQVWGEVQRAVESRGSFRVVYRINTAAQGERWVWEQGHGIFSDDGHLLALEGFITDITERKRSEEALRQAELRYRSIFDNSVHGIYQSTPEGRFLNANSALARMLGYDSPAELIANCASIERDYYVDPATRPALKRAVSDGRMVQGFECEVRRRDGRTIWTRENFYAVHDHEDRLLYYEGSVEDITDRKVAELALRASEERYRRLFLDANDIIYTTDLKGNYTSINLAGQRVTGYSNEELCRMNFRQVVVPEKVEQTSEMLARKLRGDETTTCYETEIVTRSGGRLHLELSTQLIRDAFGEPCGVQGIARDITERKRSEEALRESEERYRELFENANDVVYTHDLSGNFTSLNKTGERVTGYTREEATRLNIAGVVVPEHLELARRMIGQKQEGDESTRYELEITAKDGRRVPLEISTRLIIKDGRAVGVQGIARDITERKQAEAQLRHIAFHDALTGLPNRALFSDHLRLAVENCKRRPEGRFAVLFLDLDRFKVINDSLGHTVGDQLLVALARRLEGTLRAGDCVARLGGDEFAILLNQIAGPEDATRVAERVQRDLRLPFQIGGHEVFASGSIGIALSSTGYSNEQDVLRDADTVMYRAKSRGKPYEVFDSRMHARAVALMRLENDLRRAIDRREFCVHYQPIVALDTGHIAGFEALVRWRHPERGLVQPAEFIPVAEETGLVVPVGLLVLEAACRQMSEWHKLSPLHAALKLSVNLSGRQFSQPDLFDRVAHTLAETGFDPRCLQLELTESVIMENAKTIVPMMDRLRQLGVELAIDDFGTGYSSLSYLQRFPIHTLKIDRSFISKEGTGDRENDEIVRTIILLARNMGKDVVAEGVETEEQLERLRQLDCAYGQGFIFSRPQDAEATERLLREGLETGLFINTAGDMQTA